MSNERRFSNDAVFLEQIKKDEVVIYESKGSDSSA